MSEDANGSQRKTITMRYFDLHSGTDSSNNNLRITKNPLEEQRINGRWREKAHSEPVVL